MQANLNKLSLNLLLKNFNCLGPIMPSRPSMDKEKTDDRHTDLDHGQDVDQKVPLWKNNSGVSKRGVGAGLRVYVFFLRMLF